MWLIHSLVIVSLLNLIALSSTLQLTCACPCVRAASRHQQGRWNVQGQKGWSPPIFITCINPIIIRGTDHTSSSPPIFLTLWRPCIMMYAKCKMALNNDLIDKVLFVQNEQKMSEIRLTSQFHHTWPERILRSKSSEQRTLHCVLISGTY